MNCRHITTPPAANNYLLLTALFTEFDTPPQGKTLISANESTTLFIR